MGRIVFGLFVLGLLAIGVLIWIFEGWKEGREKVLEEASSVVETRLGVVEYVDEGEGPPVLILHGAPGGYDQAVLFGRGLIRDGFRVIAPSRPGYLRTPLAAGLLLSDQASLVNALLEKLEIERIGVLGVSVGGNVALEFASAYPAKVAGIVLLSPITDRHFDQYNLPATSELLEEKILMETTGDMGTWYAAEMAERAPKNLLTAVVDRDTDLDGGKKKKLVQSVIEDEARLDFFQDLVLTVAPLEGRESGTRNDLLMMKALRNVDLNSVKVPILVVNGESRSAKEWTDPDVILKAAPNAKELELTKVGRLVWLSPEVDVMDAEIANFFHDALGGNVVEFGGAGGDNE